MQYGAHAQGRATITSAASASATLVAAPATNSEARFFLQRGLVSIITPAGTGLGVSIYQTTAEGTQGATLFTIDHATSGTHWFDFGDKGFACSSSASRIAIENTGDATVNALFVGYHRGSGTT
jgi:hypothetical protein